MYQNCKKIDYILVFINPKTKFNLFKLINKTEYLLQLLRNVNLKCILN